MTNTNTANKTASNTTFNAAQATTDAVKSNMEAGQKMFNTFTEQFSKGFNMNTFAPAMTMPVMFEKMTKVMNGMVEANTKLVNEMTAMTVESMKVNARTMERTGEMMVAQMTGKAIKPATETAREIMEEANTFNTKTAERMTKLNTEHGQRVAAIMEETMVCKSGTCCSNN